MAGKFVKTPEASVSYSIDWASGYLVGAQTIATSVWAATPTGLTLTNETEASGVTTVKISGGTHSVEYTVRNTITTSDGFTDTRTIVISVWRPI